MAGKMLPWYLQFFAGFIGFLEMIAVCFLLAGFDGQPEPTNWVFGLTINSVTTILARSAEAFSAFGLGSAILQLCYLRFAQEETLLKVFKTYHSALRGPKGVLQLISHAIRHLLRVTIFAAILMLLNPLTTILVSQAIGSRNDLVDDGLAISPITLSYNDSAPGRAPGVPNPSLDMLKAIIGGGLNPPSERLQVEPACDTGECDWETFYTLGVGAKCVDLDAQIEYQCKGQGDNRRCNSALPDDGPSLKNQTSQLMVAAYLPFANDTAFANYPQQFVTFKVIRRVSATSSVATQCALFANVQVIRANFSHGVYKEQIIETIHNSTATFPHSGNVVADDDKYFLIRLNKQNRWIEFTVTAPAAIALQQYLIYFLEGSKTAVGGDIQYSSDVTRFIDAAMVEGKMSDFAESLALAMTTEMRTRAADSAEATGIAYKTAHLVSFRWPWILPALLIPSGTLVLLLIVRYQSKKAGLSLISGDALAILEAAPEDNSFTLLERLYHTTRLEEVAKDAVFTLRNGRLYFVRSAAYAQQPHLPMSQAYDKPWFENLFSTVTDSIN